jgi:hypothetical protein
MGRSSSAAGNRTTAPEGSDKSIRSREDPTTDFQAQPVLEFFEPSPVISGTPEPGALLLLGGSALLLFGWFRCKRA